MPEAGVNETNRAYLAGLIDGDGSITIIKRDRTKKGKSLSYSPRISISGYPPHLQGLKRIFPLGSIWVRKRKDQRHLAEWNIAGRECRLLLRLLLPYLRLKLMQAREAVAMPFCRSRWEATKELRDLQERSWLEIKRLNSLHGRGAKKWQAN